MKTIDPATSAAPPLPPSFEAVRPTYAPAALAMGVAMTAWGLLAQWSLSLAGAALVAWALARWVGEVATSWRNA